jgi:hypothetical protein
MDFTAWRAMAAGDHFGWYLVLAALIVFFGYPWLRSGLRELSGRWENSSPAPVPVVETKPTLSPAEAQARIRAAAKTWQDQMVWPSDPGPAIMLDLVRTLAKILTPAELPAADDIPAFHEALTGSAVFTKISGSQAQSLANAGQWAMAVSLPGAAMAGAAVVAPGTIYGDTPYGQDNPVVLWPVQNKLVEIQAVMAFGVRQPPDFFSVRE